MSLYITAKEYRESSTGQDTLNLIGGGNQADQDAELERRIWNASGWIDNTCNSSLIAASHVETRTVGYGSRGRLAFSPNHVHLNQLTGLSLGADGSSLNAVAASTLAAAWIEEQTFMVPMAAGSFNSAIQFGPRPRGRFLSKLTYVAGWPNTTITSSPVQGATSFTVASPVGLVPMVGSEIADEQVRIIDGGSTEVITISGVSGNTVTCSALAHAHTAGATVTMLPGPVKQAAIDATSAFLRARSSDALTIGQTLVAGGGGATGDSVRWKLLRDAADMLRPFARKR